MKAARLAIVLACLLALVLPGPPAAWAQQAPVGSVTASATEVEVGEPFTIDLEVLTEQSADAASDPQLVAPPAFTVAGPRISTKTVAHFGGGKSTVKTGLAATWTLTASAPGHYTIPSPTVTLGGKRRSMHSVEINVVPSTGRARPLPSNPFLLPGGPGLRWPFGPGQMAGDPDEADVLDERELAMDSAPDEQIFSRIVLDKKRAVIGEQITASMYVYKRAEDFNMVERHEAPLADFLRVQLITAGVKEMKYARVGDHRFLVQLIDRIALFPIRAGELHTGKMRLRFTGRRLTNGIRESNDVVVHVGETPTDGRPPGFTQGDVGKFVITAGVQPKHIDQGGSVAVTVKVTGTGNLPTSLRVPARTGVEWLDPEKRESIEPQGGLVGGWRSFGYVVRIKESGTVDLGKIELPFWDPAEKRYEVVTAVLGTVDVTSVAPALPSPSASVEPQGDSPRDPFAAMPSARTSLGSYTPPPQPPLEGGILWLLIAAPPLLVGLVGGAERVGRFAKRRRALAVSGAAARTSRALEDAEALARSGDAKEVATAVERAVHAAIEGATGLLSRGQLLEELTGELEKRGVPKELAERARATLAACDAIRFDPLASAEDLGELVGKGRALASELGRVR